MKPDYCQDSQWWCLNRTADIPSEIAKWMLVDTDQVTLSGDECNKVGVSYSAFQDESSRCLRAVNSCLGNQLENFYKSDLKALQEGTSGNYFVQFFGDFDGNEVSGANPKMRFWTDRIQSSDILLQFAAESLFHVVDVSEGKIIGANVNLVQAYSKNGKMTVTLQNTGKVEASYEVAVSCPNNILPILAQQVYILPNQTKNVTFQVDVENTHGGHFVCNVSLQNSIGQSISRYQVKVESSGINVSTGPQAGQPSGSDGTSSTNYGSSSACQKSCGSFFNIICFFEHSCWLNILYVILVVVGLLVGGCIGIKLFLHFGLSFLMDLFKMPQKRNRTRRNHRTREQDDSSTYNSCDTTPYVAPPAAVYYVPRKHHHHHQKRQCIIEAPDVYRYETEPTTTYDESAYHKKIQPVRKRNYEKIKSHHP
ncbi:uncharacterized protein Gasu_12520 [Galdieria sulphuraria]|uniref:Generative cell specific-1/HAP2 domain-containing protein n=1 Tax=Galdieria sulphuraria TaxID=130081 RepID=M2W6Z3_GALSU|nr:uncharacterized protein Gasu_12520 [Galdieria sulphuraria]EME31581.1 hypothetical protein Gasu_12520 [Galdieria sulphuraria]|eukprot:XP_005708101.1 hypothetical protein Gasu_12520 [Galdieria sulphuraria]